MTQSMVDVFGDERKRSGASRRSGLTRWFREYAGPGYYRRKGFDHSAKFAYNHLLNASSLVWLAEAAGVPAFALRKAKAALTESGPSEPSRAAAVRRVLPWALIEALLLARE